MGMSDDFYRGILVALEIVTLHDDQVVFDEIATSVGTENLVRVARKAGEMRRSGLTKYGYSHYVRRPNTASRPTALAASDSEYQARPAQRLKHDG